MTKNLRMVLLPLSLMCCQCFCPTFLTISDPHKRYQTCQYRRKPSSVFLRPERFGYRPDLAVLILSLSMIVGFRLRAAVDALLIGPCFHPAVRDRGVISRYPAKTRKQPWRAL